jgi:hypothetical protein
VSTGLYRPDLRGSASEEEQQVPAGGTGADPLQGSGLDTHFPKGDGGSVPHIRQQQRVAVPAGQLLAREGSYARRRTQPPHPSHHILVQACLGTN